MPDNTRFDTRRGSALQNELLGMGLFRSERRRSSTASTSSVSSMGGPTGSGIHVSQADSRPLRKDRRDERLEQKVLDWINSMIHERCTKNYEDFIQDGSILSRVMTSIVYNSVPVEDISCHWGSNPQRHRVEQLIKEIKKYGVKDVFELDDLLEKKDTAKVTKTLLQLAKLVDEDKDSLIHRRQ